MPDPYCVQLLPTAAAPYWPAKDPLDVRQFRADFSQLTGGVALDSCIAAESGCAVVGAATTVGAVAALLIGGGADRVAGLVALTAIWGSQSVTRAVRLPIRAQAPGLVPAPVPIATNMPVQTLVATGSSLADAQPLLAGATVITGGLPGSGCALIVGSEQRRFVRNRAAVTVLIYAPDGGSVDGQPTAVLQPAQDAEFITADGLTWTA